jgi:uncharacterized protein YdhG (YjbR/CyaY superfamily)
MLHRSTPNSIDEYLAGFPPETQKALEELPALIKASAPGTTERIGYAIPTFDFCVDSVSAHEKPVHNRTVILRDTWAKIEKRGGK